MLGDRVVDSDRQQAVEPSGESHTKSFPCAQCGATLQFAPGTQTLTCPYCGTENEIPQSEEDIRELDFRQYVAQLRTRGSKLAEVEQRSLVHCDSCGADVDLPPDTTALDCPFCGAAITAMPRNCEVIQPKSLLPFHVTRDEGRAKFRAWLGSLWFAPNKLKQYARQDTKLVGVYVPYWTYDSATTSYYRGERGEDYWETEHYTTRENGKTVHKTRQVRKTRWYPASGTVWRHFDDVLVLASNSLPRKVTESLEPWDLQNLVAFTESYLAGFRAESYQVGLEDGFENAKAQMDVVIRSDVRQDIGGDHQRIHSVRTQHDDVTFKHILLPIWISAYRWKAKVYRFLINGRTGEVQGERPYSVWKIVLAVLAGLIVAGAIAAVFAMNQ